MYPASLGLLELLVALGHGQLFLDLGLRSLPMLQILAFRAALIEPDTVGPRLYSLILLSRINACPPTTLLFH